MNLKFLLPLRCRINIHSISSFMVAGWKEIIFVTTRRGSQQSGHGRRTELTSSNFPKSGGRPKFSPSWSFDGWKVIFIQLFQ